MPYKTRKIVVHEMCVKLVEEKNSKNIDLLAFVAVLDLFRKLTGD